MFDGVLNIRQWVHQACPADLACVLDDQLLQDTSSTCDMNASLLPIFELGLLCSSEFARSKDVDERRGRDDEEDKKG